MLNLSVNSPNKRQHFRYFRIAHRRHREDPYWLAGMSSLAREIGHGEIRKGEPVTAYLYRRGMWRFSGLGWAGRPYDRTNPVTIP